MKFIKKKKKPLLLQQMTGLYLRKTPHNVSVNICDNTATSLEAWSSHYIPFTPFKGIISARYLDDKTRYSEESQGKRILWYMYLQKNYKKIY